MRQLRLVYGLSGLEGGVTLVDLVPVQDVPPRGQIFRTSVVVFQIVGMFPHIVAEDGIQALRDWIVLIRRADDLHVAVCLASQPDPSAAKLFSTGIVEFGLKIFEVPESFLNNVGDRSRGIAPTFGLHNLP